MAIKDIFKGKEDEQNTAGENQKGAETQKKDTASQQRVVYSVPEVLVRPRITEKAARLAEDSVFTFEVTPRATKQEVAKAVKKLYDVNPVKVRIVNTPATQVFSRGRRGTKSGIKKALVYLKKGETIEFV